jgi:hypothetical protein
MEPSIIHDKLPQLVSWSAGIMAIAIVSIGWRLVALHTMLQKGLLRQDHMIEAMDKLVTMHEHADDFGFGTRNTNMQLKDLLAAISTAVAESRRTGDSLHKLIHYITFEIRERTGKTPPPPPPNGSK